jgi:peptide/nickel transport system ATP-binding protein
MTKLLTVEDLSIGFGTGPDVVRGVSFAMNAGETLALVGESGSGKTLSCRAVLRILPKAAQIRSGKIVWHQQSADVDLVHLAEPKMRDLRGDRISMIFQEPMRALSPLHRIGDQVSEVLTLHRGMSKAEAKAQVLGKFDRVGLNDPERTFRAYPFELSGGMRQRAMIAMAMVAKPDLLIADEPTTALDVTTQAQVLGLIKDLQAETGMGVILVTHDLGVVANCADQVVVLRKGEVMERGPADLVLGDPAHAYTQALFKAAPVIPEDPAPSPPLDTSDPILQLRDVHKTYHARSNEWGAAPRVIKACRGINLSVARAKTLAIVGESGSGKSTCARIAIGAELPDAGGEVQFRAATDGPDLDITGLSPEDRLQFQQQVQMVFQDPYSSLSPRMRVQDVLCEPLDIHKVGTKSDRRDKAAMLLEQVGLTSQMMKRYPHAFSGGQRQRLSIARALALDPVMLVLDEPTSALDVSVQDQILTLLEDIRDRMGLSYLFISHDLAVVSRIADDVAVMRQGIIVEQAPPCTLFQNPMHPYTKALIAAQPEPDLNRPIDLKLVSQGSGSPDSWPDAFRITPSDTPALRDVGDGHKVRCHA